MSRFACALAALVAIAAPAAAGSEHDLAQGEVRRVNREQNKLTIRHGELKTIEMPPMTMVFQVRDPHLLDTLKPGDKVLFRVVKEANGALVVTEIKTAP